MRGSHTNSRRLIIAGLLSVAMIGASAAVVFQGEQRKQPGSSVKKEEPTHIRAFEMTDRQRQHSKLFKHSGPKFQELAQRQAGDIEVEVGLGLTTTLQPDDPKLPMLQTAVCNSDAVIVGTITSKDSQLTESQNFIFTDHHVTVEEVIKNNPRAPFEVGNSIVATREGGAVELNGRIFRAIREDFDPPLVGEKYLMLFHFIPETGAYLMYGDGTFHLTSQAITALGPTARADLAKHKMDLNGFIDRIRALAMGNCDNR